MNFSGLSLFLCLHLNESLYHEGSLYYNFQLIITLNISSLAQYNLIIKYKFNF